MSGIKRPYPGWFVSAFYKCQKKNRVYRQVHLRLWSYHFSSFDTVDGLQVSPFAPLKKYRVIPNAWTCSKALWVFMKGNLCTELRNLPRPDAFFHGVCQGFKGHTLGDFWSFKTRSCCQPAISPFLLPFHHLTGDFVKSRAFLRAAIYTTFKIHFLAVDSLNGNVKMPAFFLNHRS